MKSSKAIEHAKELAEAQAPTGLIVRRLRALGYTGDLPVPEDVLEDHRASGRALLMLGNWQKSKGKGPGAVQMALRLSEQYLGMIPVSKVLREAAEEFAAMDQAQLRAKYEELIGVH